MIDEQLTKMSTAGETLGKFMRWCGKNAITLVIGTFVLVVFGFICFIAGIGSGLKKKG